MSRSRPDTIGLVVADDHAVVRRGLVAFIETAADIELFGVANDGCEAVRLTKDNSPDIVLLDLLMPGQAAEETISQIKKSRPNTQIIVLTSHEGIERLDSVIKSGATSYILKNTQPDDLLDFIRRTHRGERVISQQLAQALLSREQGVREDGLTGRELEVLRAIAAGKSNRTIATEFEIAERTVKSHVSNILSKLYLSDRTQAAVYAWREGVVGRESGACASNCSEVREGLIEGGRVINPSLWSTG